MKKYLGLFLLLLAAVGIAYSQGVPSPPATSIQQSPTTLNAATKVANCNVAVNNVCTATLTPAGGNSAYITALDMEVCGDATGTVQTNVTWTTTNLTGAPIAWAYSASITAGINNVAGACIYKVVTFNPAVKSTTQGTAVTVVSPAAVLHTAYTANVFWYEAP
jgi:hypothetical protein